MCEIINCSSEAAASVLLMSLLHTTLRPISNEWRQISHGMECFPMAGRLKEDFFPLTKRQEISVKDGRDYHKNSMESWSMEKWVDRKGVFYVCLFFLHLCVVHLTIIKTPGEICIKKNSTNTLEPPRLEGWFNRMIILYVPIIFLRLYISCAQHNTKPLLPLPP